MSENNNTSASAISDQKPNLEIYNKICTFLTEKSIQYRTVEHEPTFTSEESAKARGEDLSTGGKAILMRFDEKDFRLFVLSASKKIDSKKVKKLVNCKSTRFATSAELLTLTGLVPGSVPPFGKSILPFELYVDETIVANEKIAFNAGSLTNSIVMTVKDYLSVANATVACFSTD